MLGRRVKMPVAASMMRALLSFMVEASAIRQDGFMLGCLALFRWLKCVDERRRLDRQSSARQVNRIVT